MNEITEIEKLAAALKTERPRTKIYFYEEFDSDACSKLIVETHGNRLLVKLACLFGCSDMGSHWADCIRFEADDDWQGCGKVDLHGLVDEFIDNEGESFPFSITVAELRLLARCRRYRRRVFVSVDDLKQAIDEFLANWNTDPKPFVWTTSTKSFLQKFNRCRLTLEKLKSDCTRSGLQKKWGSKFTHL